MLTVYSGIVGVVRTLGVVAMYYVAVARVRGDLARALHG